MHSFSLGSWQPVFVLLPECNDFLEGLRATGKWAVSCGFRSFRTCHLGLRDCFLYIKEFWKIRWVDARTLCQGPEILGLQTNWHQGAERSRYGMLGFRWHPGLCPARHHSDSEGPTRTSHAVSHLHWCTNLGMSAQRWCFLPYPPGTDVLPCTLGHQLWPVILCLLCLMLPWMTCHVAEKEPSPLPTVLLRTS